MNITVYADFSCPLSFLAHQRAVRLEAQGPGEVDWREELPTAPSRLCVLGASGPVARQPYQLGAPPTKTELLPFVEPELCLVRLSTVG